MKYSILIVIVLGLIAAICMAGIVGVLPAYLRVPGHATTRPAPQAKVLVATRDLPAMTIVDAGSVTTKTVGLEAAPAERLSDAVQAIGKVLVVPMTEGQAFTKHSFVSDGSGAQLAAALPNGKRAVTVALESDASLRTLIYPGCLVDVITSFKSSSSSGASARTLLQNVQVLAVEDKTIVTSAKTEPGSPVLRQEVGRKCLVTLMVDLEQARLLQAAQREGSVSLALRNPLDTTQPAFPAAEEDTAPPDPAPRSWELQILRDGKSEIRKFTSVEPE